MYLCASAVAARPASRSSLISINICTESVTVALHTVVHTLFVPLCLCCCHQATGLAGCTRNCHWFRAQLLTRCLYLCGPAVATRPTGCSSLITAITSAQNPSLVWQTIIHTVFVPLWLCCGHQASRLQQPPDSNKICTESVVTGSAHKYSHTALNSVALLLPPGLQVAAASSQQHYLHKIRHWFCTQSLTQCLCLCGSAVTNRPASCSSLITALKSAQNPSLDLQRVAHTMFVFRCLCCYFQAYRLQQKLSLKLQAVAYTLFVPLWLCCCHQACRLQQPPAASDKPTACCSGTARSCWPRCPSTHCRPR
jgi:hypothetical protein